MNTRRIVEQFGESKWKQDPGQDGKNYVVHVVVNGAREEFTLVVPVSNTIRATRSVTLGRQATEADWEAAAKVKIMKALANGTLDSWPPSVTCILPSIASQEVDDLLGEAMRRHLILG